MLDGVRVTVREVMEQIQGTVKEYNGLKYRLKLYDIDDTSILVEI